MMCYRSLILLALCVLCWTGAGLAETMRESAGQVWQVGSRRWDIAEEQRFAAWVEKTVTDDFFIRYDIPADCADVPYALRWIYARIAHLPAAATNEDGRLFGHWSTAWGHLPASQDWFRDLRFRRALLSMLEETSTKTIPADTYPIRIAPDSVLAGTVFLGDEHAGIVGRIVVDGSMYSPVQTWQATLPRKVTRLRQSSFFSTWPDAGAGSGLVRFRWPVSFGRSWAYLPRSDQPFSSDEQYSPGFCRTGELFDEAVARRIDPTVYDPLEKTGKIIGSIYRYLLERVPLVRAGYAQCRHQNCPEGSPLWEIYSTPGRDEMIAYEIQHLLKIIKDSGLNQGAVKTMMQGMTIPIEEGQTVDLDYIVQNYPWLSHDPGASIEARWGLRRCEMIRAGIQNALRALDYVQQRYSAADPEYAEYSRSLRLQEIKRLREEEKRAGCTEPQPLSQEKPLWPTLKIIQMK